MITIFSLLNKLKLNLKSDLWAILGKELLRRMTSCCWGVECFKRWWLIAIVYLFRSNYAWEIDEASFWVRIWECFQRGLTTGEELPGICVAPFKQMEDQDRIADKQRRNPAKVKTSLSILPVHHMVRGNPCHMLPEQSWSSLWAHKQQILSTASVWFIPGVRGQPGYLVRTCLKITK